MLSITGTLKDKKGQNIPEQLGQRKALEKRLTTINGLPSPPKQWECGNETHECEFGKIHCGKTDFSIKISSILTVEMIWIFKNCAPRKKELTGFIGKSSDLFQSPRLQDACLSETTIMEIVMPNKMLLTEAQNKSCSLSIPSYRGQFLVFTIIQLPHKLPAYMQMHNDIINILKKESTLMS